MTRRAEIKQPYLKGYVFWGPILSEWIASDRYTEAAKEEFMRSLEEMLKEKDLLKIAS